MRNRILLAILTTTVICSSATAQSAPSAWTVSAGIGQGSGWPTCDNCTGIDHRQGLTGFARVGRFLTPMIALSLEANRWNNKASDADSQFQSLLAVGQFFLQPHGGLSLSVGAGIGGSLIKFNDGFDDEISSTGFSYKLGLQYDFPIASQWSIAPFGDFLATSWAPEQVTGLSGTGNLDGNVLRFGVAVSWR